MPSISVTGKQQSGGCNMPDQLPIGKMHSVFIINEVFHSWHDNFICRKL